MWAQAQKFRILEKKALSGCEYSSFNLQKFGGATPEKWFSKNVLTAKLGTGLSQMDLSLSVITLLTYTIKTFFIHRKTKKGRTILLES